MHLVSSGEVWNLLVWFSIPLGQTLIDLYPIVSEIYQSQSIKADSISSKSTPYVFQFLTYNRGKINNNALCLDGKYLNMKIYLMHLILKYFWVQAYLPFILNKENCSNTFCHEQILLTVHFFFGIYYVP